MERPATRGATRQDHGRRLRLVRGIRGARHRRIPQRQEAVSPPPQEKRFLGLPLVVGGVIVLQRRLRQRLHQRLRRRRGTPGSQLRAHRAPSRRSIEPHGYPLHHRDNRVGVEAPPGAHRTPEGVLGHLPSAAISFEVRAETGEGATGDSEIRGLRRDGDADPGLEQHPGAEAAERRSAPSVWRGGQGAVARAHAPAAFQTFSFPVVRSIACDNHPH
mmetsp:Transcript_7976/g.22065  ORF Transcript_7976/g.22065 Transcript_7976/m.22065 type:complete len:217 (+) Transcript_7976:3849-4499(+)